MDLMRGSSGVFCFSILQEERVYLGTIYLDFLALNRITIKITLPKLKISDQAINISYVMFWGLYSSSAIGQSDR